MKRLISPYPVIHLNFQPLEIVHLPQHINKFQWNFIWFETCLEIELTYEALKCFLQTKRPKGSLQSEIIINAFSASFEYLCYGHMAIIKYRRSGDNIREVLIFVNFARTTNSQIQKSRSKNNYYNSATKEKEKFANSKLREVSKSEICENLNTRKSPDLQ